MPVSTRLIKEIHEKLMQGVRGSHLTPGEIRKTQNWIGPGGCSLNEAAFIPPPPDELPQMLSDLEKYLLSDSKLPLLIKIGLAHAQFETLHSFLDGYERMSTQAAFAAKLIILLREKHRNLITATLSHSAGGALQVLEHLYTNPIVSVRDIMVGPPRLIRVPYPCQKTQPEGWSIVLIRYIGLDVHKDSIKIAVAEEGREPARFYASIPGENNKLISRIRKLGPEDSLRCCYEAGPGGYTVYRALTAAGIDCKVIAPSKIPKQSGKRVKTDRLDSENLAHYLRSGDLTEVWVPDETTESIRNLVRLREDARIARLKARQQ